MSCTQLNKKWTFLFPKGAWVLFLIQAFAVIPFSILYSTLMLYATTRLHLSDHHAADITASYLAFNSGLSLLGGCIAGRYVSYRLLFFVSMFIQVIGGGLLSIPTISAFSWGLAAMLLGACFAVTCLNCMLTQLFLPNDKRRETAFMWSYSSMNIGAFIGFTISGYCQLHGNYHELFLLGGLGNLLALYLTAYHWKLLGDINTRQYYLSVARKMIYCFYVAIVMLILFLLLHLLLGHAAFSNALVILIGIMMIMTVGYLALQSPTVEERNKLLAYLVLAVTALIFWTLYLLAPLALTLFIERNVDRHYLGILIAPQWVQNINTMVIILGGPCLSLLFNHLRSKGVRLTIAVQFSFSLILIGIALAILPIGIYFSNSHGYSNINWILTSCILQSVGELFISPIGYAMVGQLVPVRLQGLMMGAWLMMTGVAAIASEYFSKMALENTDSINPLVTNPSFSHAFGMLGWIAISTGVLLIILIPAILHLTQEKKLEMSNLTGAI